MKEVLQSEKSFCNEKGELLVEKVLSKQYKTEVIKLLLGNSETKQAFFEKIGDALVFKNDEFLFYIKTKDYLENSYTAFDNKIGFNNQKQLDNNVVLNFPYKDCVLEGGQTKDDEKRKEIFFNEILAKDEIKRLTEPKVLTNFEKYTINGKEDFQNFTRDAEINKKRGLSEDTITDNLLVKGNNLLVLYSLVEEFRGKVKLIYIDPPYNTGNDSFNYNDNFNHSSWLCFMKNRLEIAKELLRDDGVIFISIDEREQAYLKVLCDDILKKRDNFIFISIFTWQDKYTTTNDKIGVSSQTEFILCYSKKEFVPNKLPLKEEYVKNNYKYDDNDGNGKYMTVQMYKKKNPYSYEIVSPFGKVWNKPWNFTKTSFQNLIDNNKVFWGEDGNACPRKKVYLKDTKGINPTNLLLGSEIAYSEDGGNEIEKLFFNRTIFLNSKPEALIKHLINISTNPNDIILDFFAGSGTTGAVAHKMNRQWIMVEQMDYIETITKERMKKVIAGEQGGISKSVNWQGGGEFVYFELKKYNENFVDMLNKAETKEEVVNIFQEICKKGFVKYNIDIKALNDDINKGNNSEFLSKSIEEMKENIYNILNKNMLFVPLSAIDDEKFCCSNEEKVLSKNFYNNK